VDAGPIGVDAVDGTRVRLVVLSVTPPLFRMPGGVEPQEAERKEREGDRVGRTEMQLESRKERSERREE